MVFNSFSRLPFLFLSFSFLPSLSLLSLLLQNHPLCQNQLFSFSPSSSLLSPTSLCVSWYKVSLLVGTGIDRRIWYRISNISYLLAVFRLVVSGIQVSFRFYRVISAISIEVSISSDISCIYIILLFYSFGHDFKYKSITIYISTNIISDFEVPVYY